MNKRLNFEKNHLKHFIVIGCLAFLIISVLVIGMKFKSKEGENSVISEASLKQVLEIDELSTLEYFYNSIATKNVESSEKVEYHVRYEGTVRLGIEFEDISIEINEDNKEIKVKIPEVKIIDHKVEPETLDFIFLKDKYETESVLAEANELCNADLKSKVEDSSSLFDLARENAVSSIEALLRPWIEQVDAEYVVTVE